MRQIVVGALMLLATKLYRHPPLPPAHLRGRGQLTEWRTVNLRFPLNEVAGFLNHGISLRLLADDMAALGSRTEGWIVGLPWQHIPCKKARMASDKQGTLERMPKSNQFLVPLDNKHPWYRYHHLFTDLLH